MIDISKELANFFENKGFAQKDIAKMLGTSPQYISAIFSGRKRKDEQIDRLIRLLEENNK